MLETLWAFVLSNNYPLAGGRGCSSGGGDGLWASLGMGELGIGTGLDSVVSWAFMEVPSRTGSCLGVSWSHWKRLVLLYRWVYAGRW